ncbi:flagellar hook-basal body protein [Oscillospiraceae bacterium 44-34]
MMRGFYNLTSGMLSQGRRLDVVANNMTNVSTAGYKAEHYTDRTFDEVMVTRIGNKIKTPYQTMETYQSHILAPDQLYTDFGQSSFEQTNLPLDFAIQGEGFFAIETGNGVAYTRAGSFTLDNEGYLCLSELGRVLDREGNPIQLPTDKLEADQQGNLFTKGGEYLGSLGVFMFEDNNALERTPYGLFTGEGAQINENAVIHHKWVERSNVNLVKEMVSMMSTQRALQSAAQMSKIYDEVIKRGVNDIGRL